MEDIEKPGYWAVIPASVRYDDDIEPNAKLLYAEISSLTGRDGYCWASNDYFAHNFSLCDRTIRRLLNSLQRKGYIRIEDGDNARRKIFAGVNPLHDDPDKNVRAPGQNCPANPDKNVRHNNKKNNKSISDESSGPSCATWKPERFEGMWKFYPHPNNDRKSKAREAWDKLMPDDATIKAMGQGLRFSIDTDEWQRGIGIPHMSTYINGRYWEDALERKRQAVSEPNTASGWAPDPEVM